MSTPRLLGAGALCLSLVSPTADAREQSVDEVRALVADGRFALAAERARAAGAVLPHACSESAAELECLRAEALRRGPERLSPRTLEIAAHAVSLMEELFGANDARAIGPRLQLGALHCIRREWAEARSCLTRAAELSERAFGDSDPRRAMALVYLGYLTFRADTDIDQAAQLLAHARAVQDASLPRDDPDRAFVLEMEAIVRAAVSDDEAACELRERALAIRRQCQRPDHPAIANAVSELAAMRMKVGDLAGAQAGFEELAALLEGGAEIPALPTTLFTNLGVVLHATGQWEDAERSFHEALLAHERGGTAATTDYGAVLDLLARLAFDRGDFEPARALIDRALDVLRGSGAQNPAALASAITLHAWIELQEGKSASIDSAIAEIRALSERSGSDGRDFVRQTLELEAMIAMRAGDYQHACARYIEAARIEREIGGDAHPELAQTLRYHSRAAYLGGDGARALDLALEAEDIAHAHWIAVAPRLAELSAIGLGETRGRDSALEAALRYAADTHDPGAAERVWSAILRRRDQAFAETATRAALVRAAEDPDLRRAARRLSLARNRQAMLHVRATLQRPGESPTVEELNAAGKEREAAERELAGLGAELASSTARGIDFGSLREALPADTALVSYVFSREPVSGAQVEWRRAAYALVLPSPTEAPIVLALGDAASIVRLVQELDDEGRSGADEQRWRRVATELRRRVWDPAAGSIGAADSVFLVLAGDLQRVPFGTLPVGDAEYLVETGPVLHVLDSERTLFEERPHCSAASGLLAVADPMGDSPEKIEVLDRPDGGSSRGAWSALVEARSEIADIQDAWASGPHAEEPFDARIGAQADEQSLRDLARGRRIVHIATHGYYEPALPTGVLAPTRGLPVYESAVIETPLRVASTSEPWLRSGLVLSPPACGDAVAPATFDDGILTAAEVLDLSLDGVEWIVLSACDSALGELRSGESILGLRRAFRIAGARTVISSVWPVEDRAARRWMRSLYRARCLDHKTTAESVRAASLSALAELRKSGESTHPQRWGSFVATGDWR